MKFPLPFGLYKLREAGRTLREFAGTLQEIQGMELGIGQPEAYLLGCCTVADRAIWLKALPEAVTFQLGYNIQPAIAALPGDGMPGPWCRRLNQLLDVDIRRLVAECDDAKSRNGRIEVEYSAMRSGRCPLLELVSKAIDLVDRAIEVAEQYENSRRHHDTNHQRDLR